MTGEIHQPQRSSSPGTGSIPVPHTDAGRGRSEFCRSDHETPLPHQIADESREPFRTGVKPRMLKTTQSWHQDRHQQPDDEEHERQLEKRETFEA